MRSVQALDKRVDRLRHALRLSASFGAGNLARPRELLESIAAVFGTLGGADHEPRRLAARLASVDPGAVADLRRRTQALLEGRIEILGLAPLPVGDPPDWHREAACGRRAPRRHWSVIPFLDVAAVGDHKVLWEVNRHQYLLAPAMCWLLDADPRALQLVQRHLASWLEENPPGIGVNWSSSLEIAYRSITWCWLLWLLHAAPWEESLLARLQRALEIQGRHVERHLSLYFSPNTHLTGEALALFCLGSVLPGAARARRWRARGAALLESALARQVRADGVYFEQAMLYHRYSVEIYLLYLRLAAASGWNPAPAATVALGALLDVLRSVADGAARIPLFGDDDGGALLPFDQRDPASAAGVLLAGAVTLSRPELVPPGPAEPLLAYALCGVAATDRRLASAPVEPAWRELLFASGGLAVLRDGWSRESAVAVVDTGPHGALNGAHAHADALSMTLTLAGTPVFVDRGTLTYVGPERNEYRGTASHNTLEFDAEPSVEPRSPFRWGPTPPRATATLRADETVLLLRASARGHAGSPRPSTHLRVVAHRRGGAWLVFDRGVRGEGGCAMVRWQLAPGVQALGAPARGCTLSGPDGRPLALLAMPLAPDVQARSREVSPRYGARVAATVLEARTDGLGRAVSLVVPARRDTPCEGGERGAVPRFDIGSADDDPGATMEWRDAQGRHRLNVPPREPAGRGEGAPEVPGGALAVAGWLAWAELLWASDSRPEAGAEEFEPDRLIVLGASRLRTPTGLELLAEGGGGRAGGGGRDVVAGRSPAGWAILPLTDAQRGRE